MMNFTPADWMEIGASLISTWFGSRLLFLLVCGMFGAEPAPQQIEVAIKAAVVHERPTEEDYSE